MSSQLRYPKREEVLRTSTDPLLRMLVQRKRIVVVKLQMGATRLQDGAYLRFHWFDGEEIASHFRNDRGRQVNWNTTVCLVDGVSPDVPVAVANTLLLSAVTMAVGFFNFLQSLMLCRSLGTRSSSTRWPDVPLSTCIVIMSALRCRALLLPIP